MDKKNSEKHTLLERESCYPCAASKAPRWCVLLGGARKATEPDAKRRPANWEEMPCLGRGWRGGGAEAAYVEPPDVAGDGQRR